MRVQTKRRIIAAAGITVFLGALTALYIAAGAPVRKLLSDPEAFREWVSRRGWMGRLAFMGLMVLQIVVAVIPGEPLEIAAGYAFGAIEGTALCLVGAAIGGATVFWFVRKLGVRALEMIFSREKIDEVKFLRDERRTLPLMLVLFLIPGTPKDILCYAAGLTRVRFWPWLAAATLGRIPSVLTSTVGGSALGSRAYALAAAVFGGTAILAAAGMIVYRHISRRKAG